MAPTTQPPSSSSDGIIDKISNFVAENKKVILIGATVAAAGGVGYYVYSQGRGPSGSDPKSLEAGEKKKKKKAADGAKKKGVNDADGPLLEERKPKVKIDEKSTDAPGTRHTLLQCFRPLTDSNALSGVESPELSPAEIAAMPRAERASLAAQYKSRGNAAYQKRDFTRAIELYSKAIAVAAVPEAVFFSNRAACTCRALSGSVPVGRLQCSGLSFVSQAT